MALDLTSSSTWAQVTAAYENNADYDLSSSVTKCRDFIQACRFYLRRLPIEIKNGNASVKEDPDAIKPLLRDAEAWLRVNDSTAATRIPNASVKFADFGNFRG